MKDGHPIARTWWRDRIDYDWLVDTLRSHEALGTLKRVLAGAGLVMLVITVVAALSPSGQTGAIGLTQAGIVASVAVLWTLRWWLLPWPSEIESLIWVALADVAITANNILVQDRLLGAMGSALLVTTGGYVTIFHGPRYLLLHVGWSLLSIVLLSIMLVRGNGHGAGDIGLGIVVVLVSFVVDGFVLPLVQFCHWILRRDALSDPLTGLMNRRGLDYYLPRFPRNRRGGMYIATVDLDRFKAVNDTYGHAFGDEVLIRTARRLRSVADPNALVVRAGGEEFVIVGHLRDRGDNVGERLRGAIETMPDLPVTVTASVGIAVSDGCEPACCELLHLSDTAMYAAKRGGGNAVVVAGDLVPIRR
ncbi:GGDEF domain-containing protein [Nocardia pseudobrasiliensis]|uniref:Diguanylate cyclase n=1 Tax=Nocardia pseudobrasiliensis TaxID=45979 RepID=A0A370IB58_9NOCA|nr:GGDEF domain-containing protein [Nocardia pseudobrasiliensis]RDI67953.1 diguanylate cyclase [Nocardia pseudobrasiliensis]